MKVLGKFDYFKQFMHWTLPHYSREFLMNIIYHILYLNLNYFSDHITSCSAIVFPVKKLVKLAAEYGAMSLIDGAHAPGQLQLNLEDIGADFYSGKSL